MSKEIKNVCDCLTCPFLRDYRATYGFRHEFHCGHPDRQYIENYHKEHGIKKYPPFIGYSKPDMTFPIKRTPKWCPKLKEAGGHER